MLSAAQQTNEQVPKGCFGSAQDSAASTSRTKLILEVFSALDRDGDGYLNEQEVRLFAGHTGFEGGDDQWASEYRMLCSSYQGTHHAIPFPLFAKLIDDETDDGMGVAHGTFWRNGVSVRLGSFTGEMVLAGVEMASHGAQLALGRPEAEPAAPPEAKRKRG